ncbi:MAG: replication-associated recombination protein A, partial [Pirellulaceae bacterium]|nr:replication-associated recombination protein A [Pirellulaceae bacterium]
EFIGLPECQLTLSQTVIYLALAEKSNSATVAIGNARREVSEGKLIPVPIHLRDKHYAGAEKLGHGKNYTYTHDSATGIVAQDYLGVERRFFELTERGWEGQNRAKLEAIRELLRSAKTV